MAETTERAQSEVLGTRISIVDIPAYDSKDKNEYFEEDGVVRSKATEIADLIRTASFFAVYTGAGVSSAAGIPTYRGPDGIWTKKDAGETAECDMFLDEATPTYFHMALRALYEKGQLQHVCTTNVDGLHHRSGIAPESLSELHGNIYRERCEKCAKVYTRNFDILGRVNKRYTGRLCEEHSCRGKLRDTIVNFGENLPEDQLQKATRASRAADLSFCAGSSMRVSPACTLPGMADKMVICNLQTTPFDTQCSVRVFAKVEVLWSYIMDELAVDVQPWVPPSEEELHAARASMVEDPTFKAKLGSAANVSMADGGAPPPDVLAELLKRTL